MKEPVTTVGPSLEPNSLAAALHQVNNTMSCMEPLQDTPGLSKGDIS